MVKCKVCQESNAGNLYQIREMMFGLRKSFEYYQCPECECLQLTHIPKDIGKYYNPENYYSFGHRKTGIFFWLKRERTKAYMNEKGVIGMLMKKKYPNLSFAAIAKLKPDKSSNILDVGCGDGELLYLLSSIGFKNMMGIDPFIKADIQYPTGVEVLKTDIHALDKTRKWDIIMLHHVFEHVPDPLETLISLKQALAANGTLMIRIPTTSSYAWKNYKENWFQIDAPRHSFLHSIKSMKMLIHQSGLKLRDYYYDSDEKQFWASEQYQKDIPLMAENSYANNPSKSPITAEKLEEYKVKSQQLNDEKQGDQVVFLIEHI